MATSIPCLVLVALSVNLQVAELCPNFWTTYDGSCYALIDTPSTWAEGEELCGEFKSHLAFVESEEEKDFIKHFLQSKNLPVKHTWIGGNDLVQEGSWQWQNGETIKEFSDWCSTEPDNQGGQDCMAMAVLHRNTFTCNWQWDDEACDRRYSVLCEQPDLPKGLIG